jgi:intein/homing endonuclease
MLSPTTGKYHKVQDAYVVQTSDHRILDALGEPYDPKRHVCWSYQRESRIWTRVKSVKLVAYSGPVYDLEVTGDGTYTANNAVVQGLTA